MNQTPNSSLNLSFEHSRDGSGIRCAFCNGEHYSSACEEVKEIQKRKNILRRDKRFLCLSVGHRANQCTRKKQCRVCDRTDHHQSVCEMSSNQSRSEPPAAPTNAKTELRKIESLSSHDGYINVLTNQSAANFVSTNQNRAFRPCDLLTSQPIVLAHVTP